MRILLRNAFVPLLLAILGFVLPCIGMESALRIDQYVRKGIPLLRNPSALWDAELGWVGREHVLPGGTKPPVLVLGDSFTDGMGVPSEKMWFASLAKLFPDHKIIAYGGLGYGTLQELLMLKRYKAQGVSPAAVVLQMCSNDIINNYFPIERESSLQRAPGPRPYLENNVITLRMPRSYDWFLTPLVSVSRVASRYATKWETKLAASVRESHTGSIEFDIQARGYDMQLFRDAVAVTDRLMGMLKETAGDAPVVAVLVDDLEPYTDALRTSARKHGISLIRPIRGVGAYPELRMADGTHFNEDGNRMLGEKIITDATARGLFADFVR